MRNYYVLQNQTISNTLLWRTDPASYKVIQFDEMTPILYGSDYTLIENRFLKAFDQMLMDQIIITPVTIYRKATEEVWNNYSELIIKNQLVFNTLEQIDPNSHEIFNYYGLILVTPPVRRIIDEIPNNSLSFDEPMFLG